MILLDTHVLIWWASGDLQRLSPRARAAIEADIERVAQARELAVPLLSADRKIRDYPHGQSLW